MISYAQNHEDVLLERCFKDRNDGFYIDVGAWDPVLHSVTQHFYEKGWRGINLEPVPANFESLVKARERDINLPIALSDTETETMFTVVTGSGLSTLRTLDDEHLRDLERGGYGNEHIMVTTRTLASVCSQYVPSGQDIDFLKVDVEGWEAPVLFGGDWQKFRPKVVLVEVVTPIGFDPDAARVEVEDESARWQPFLLGQGYLFAANDGLNRYFVRQEDADLLRHFAVPVNALDEYLPLSLVRVQQDVAALTARLTDLETAIARSNAELAAVAAQRDEAIERARMLRESTSWRITSPLRSVKSWVRGHRHAEPVGSGRPAVPGGLDLPSKPLSVALYSGIVIRFDAVSSSLVHKFEILSRLRDSGSPIRVTVFTQGTDYDWPEIVTLGSAADVIQHPDFLAADVHIFEFGMYYELLDAIDAIPPNVPTIAIDHSTTPPELVDSVESRRRCELAIERRNRLGEFSHVACDSEYNRDHLAVEHKIPSNQLSVLHLPPACSYGGVEIGGPVRSSVAGPVRLLFVGRFVRAKGVSDLIAATRPHLEAHNGNVTLTLVGDTRFSDDDVLEQIGVLLHDFGAAGAVRHLVAVDDSTLGRLYLSSDALVLPSYHEGYCVPIAEALWAGCFPITYDSGNLPNVSGGLGVLVPAGDVAALRDAIGDFVGRVRAARLGDEPLKFATASGEIAEADWRDRVGPHLADYSLAKYEETFLDTVSDVTGRSRHDWATA